MDWLAALDPRVLIVGVALLGVLLAIPFLLASLRPKPACSRIIND